MNSNSEREAREIFSVFDQNGDGELDHAELLEALKDFGANEALIKKLITKFDTNNNGRIDLDEFVKLCATLRAEQRDFESEFEKTVREIFAHIDRDNSETLDGSELFEALQQFGTTEDEIKKFVYTMLFN
jgi:Ca2+-binding EF-hand superfamily protein